MTKTCVRCHKNLSLQFFREDKRYADGHTSWCKNCHKENNKIHYITSKRWKDIQKKYGISKEKYEEMEKRQGGVCACCKQSPKDRGRNGSFVVDHCHTTGVVRGLLCAKCNAGIGFFDDDPELLVLASTYLKTYDDSCCQCSAS